MVNCFAPNKKKPAYVDSKATVEAPLILIFPAWLVPLNIAITSLSVVVPIYKQVALALWAVKNPPLPKVQPTVAVPAPLLPVEPSWPEWKLRLGEAIPLADDINISILPAAPNSKVFDECWYLTWPLILESASPKAIPVWPVPKIVIPVFTVCVDPNTASLYTELAVPWGELSYTKVVS